MKKTVKLFSREAMDDADKILETLNDPNNSRALTVKGDALYNLGNFEHALLNYHRAIRNSSTKVSKMEIK
jgi:predicted negative regulator of RcsB-dependent stress response